MAIIRISSELTMETFREFSKKMAYLEGKKDAVKIELSSEGGSAYAALAYSALIRNSPLNVEITAYGFVASAAVLILASGDIRFMTKEAWVMVHEDSGKLKGDVVALEREAAQLRRLELQWAELLQELTGTKASIWTALHKETTYLNAAQCVGLNLVDDII